MKKKKINNVLYFFYLLTLLFFTLMIMDILSGIYYEGKVNWEEIFSLEDRIYELKWHLPLLFGFYYLHINTEKEIKKIMQQGHSYESALKKRGKGIRILGLYILLAAVFFALGIYMLGVVNRTFWPSG